jgi:hypothetical protein
VSLHHPISLTRRTSLLIVHEPDIFNCSRHDNRLRRDSTLAIFGSRQPRLHNCLPAAAPAAVKGGVSRLACSARARQKAGSCPFARGTVPSLRRDR